MAWLPDRGKSMKTSLFVSTEFTNVTDTETHGHRMIWHRPRLHSIALQKCWPTWMMDVSTVMLSRSSSRRGLQVHAVLTVRPSSRVDEKFSFLKM